MKRYTTTLCALLLVGSSTLYADQLKTSDTTPVLRHVQGMKSVGLQGGKTSLGGEMMLVGDYYFSPQWKVSVGLGKEADKWGEHRYQSFFLQPLAGYTLYAHPKYFVLRVLGGAKLSLDSLQTKKQMRQGDARSYTGSIGLVGGGEVECFVTKRISVVLSGGLRRFLWSSPDLSKNDYFLHLGFRFSL